jgi:hypothetical protein
MRLGRAAPRAASIILVTLMIIIVGSSCEPESSSRPTESAEGTSPPVPGSPSDVPESDVEVHTYAVTSLEELFEPLLDTGWADAVVLRDAVPIQLELWTGGGHWHAQTTYRSSGRRVQVTQAGSEGLPPGQLVAVRGENGVRSDGGLYWLERGFTLAISPGKTSIARALEWISLPLSPP